MEPDNKIFIRGRTTIEEDKDAKLICQEIIPLMQYLRSCGLNLKTAQFQKAEQELYSILESTMEIMW